MQVFPSLIPLDTRASTEFSDLRDEGGVVSRVEKLTSFNLDWRGCLVDTSAARDRTPPCRSVSCNPCAFEVVDNEIEE